MEKELSLIVPCLNEEKYLPILLRSLQKQNFQGKLQIIIVDGGSTDKTIAVASEFQTHFSDLLVLKTTKGIAHQRNFGVQKAKYQSLLFVDADIVLPSFFLNKLFSKLSPQKNIICAFFLWGSEVDLLDYLSFLIFFPFFIPIGMYEKATPGGLMYTTKAVHNRIGGFDDRFKLGEDLDYGKRAVKTGAHYRYFFSPFAFHSPRRLRKMGRLQFWFLYIKGIYLVKRYGIKYLDKHFNYPFAQYDKK